MEEPEFNWKDILAVYAVIVSTGSDAITFNEQKAILLKDIFWSFTELDYESEDYEEVETIEVYDEFGNPYEQEVTVSKTKLRISYKQKYLSEVIQTYALNNKQMEQLDELLSDENQNLWNDLII